MMARTPRILSLDGGGIRGLSTLKILEEIMEDIRQVEGLPETPLPRDYFDLIGGTSTGGIIAIMLGRLGMSVDDAIKAYRAVGEKAFTPKHFFTLPAAPTGFYSATKLEEAIKQIIKEQCQEAECRGAPNKVQTCKHEGKLFRDLSSPKTVALAITKDNIDARPTLFATYHTDVAFKDCPIWQVARATSAATTFFKSIKCGRDQIEFIDAGFGYNNPCEVIIEEARRLFPEASTMRILSIGTGLGGVVTVGDSRRSILHALKTMASNSKKVADRLDDAYGQTGSYFRFNVDSGLERITLADWEQSSSILAHTLNYINDHKRALAKCAATISENSESSGSFRRSVDANESRRMEIRSGLPTTSGSRSQQRFEQIETNPIRPASEAKVFDIPLDTNKNYVVRESIVKQLDDILRPTERAHSTSRRAALYGLGGSGKTELAIRFAEIHREHYSAVFWINATDSTYFMSGFSRIASILNIGNGTTSEVTMDLARDWLSTHSGWLLVIDNIDEDAVLNLLHRKILRAGMTGTVLVTGRNEAIKTQWNAIEVSNMETNEALTLLRNITGLAFIERDATKLLQDLGHLPLAIDQAATFMAETGMSVERYRRLFDAERSSLLEKYPSTQYNINGRESVMTTWEISFKRVESSHAQAATLLLMLSLFHYEQIPLGILESCLGGQNFFSSSGEFRAVADRERWIPNSLRPTLNSEIRLAEELAALRKYSFVRQKTDSSALHIHPLVHFWALKRLQMDPPLQTQLSNCVLGLIASAFQKQDRLPPLCSRTSGSRGLEDAKLGIWPLRRYTDLTTQTLHCLRTAERSIPAMPRTVICLTLSLLQVFEYSTYSSFETDQQFILSLLDAATSRAVNDLNGSLNWSVLLWRLARADLCSCRKDMGIAGSEIQRVATKGDFCERCRRTFAAIQARLLSCSSDWNENAPKDSLTRCLVDCMVFKLAADPFWKYFAGGEETILRQFLNANPHLRGEYHLGSRDFKSRASGLSWVQSYGLATRRYMILRSHAEYDYKNPRVRAMGAIAEDVDGLNRIDFFDGNEPMDIAHVFRDLCGEQSEEYRRAAFYASFA